MLASQTMGTGRPELAIGVHQEAFSHQGSVLDRVNDFWCLGGIFLEQDSDWPALHQNLTRAHQKWAVLFRILVWEGASPEVSGHLFKAGGMVQSVLLCGSETWAWTKCVWLALQGFHNGAAGSQAHGPVSTSSK